MTNEGPERDHRQWKPLTGRSTTGASGAEDEGWTRRLPPLDEGGPGGVPQSSWKEFPYGKRNRGTSLGTFKILNTME